MKLYPKKGNGGHITSYFVNLGSKEARDAGFVNEDKTTNEIRKIVDPENHRIILVLQDSEER